MVVVEVGALEHVKVAAREHVVEDVVNRVLVVHEDVQLLVDLAVQEDAQVVVLVVVLVVVQEDVLQAVAHHALEDVEEVVPEGALEGVEELVPELVRLHVKVGTIINSFYNNV